MKIIGKFNFLFVPFLLFLLIPSSINFAQGTKSDPPNKSQQVVLHVTVWNKDGDFVTGLERHHFKVYEDKTEHPITLFKVEDEPLSVGILFDISGSIHSIGAYPLVLKGLTRFVETSNPANEYFLTAFNEEQQLRLDYSQDRSAVFRAINDLSTLKAGRGTNFFDAVSKALEKISKSKYQKRVLIVVTDGDDNNSELKLKELKNTLRKSNVLIYVFGAWQQSGGEGARWDLNEIVKSSGGRAVYPMKVDNLGQPSKRMSDFYDRTIRAYFVAIANELRNQYTIGFEAGTNLADDKKEKWRKLKVEAELPPGLARAVGKVQVHTREGYLSSAVTK